MSSRTLYRSLMPVTRRRRRVVAVQEASREKAKEEEVFAAKGPEEVLSASAQRAKAQILADDFRMDEKGKDKKSHALTRKRRRRVVAVHAMV